MCQYKVVAIRTGIPGGNIPLFACVYAPCIRLIFGIPVGLYVPLMTDGISVLLGDKTLE